MQSTNDIVNSLRMQAATNAYEAPDDIAFFTQLRLERIQSEDLRFRMLIERAIIRKFVQDVISQDESYLISVNDGEETTVKKSRDISTIMGAIMTTDEDWLIVHQKTDTEVKVKGRVYLVYGNDGHDVICDNSVSIDSLLAGAQQFADEICEVVV